MLKRAWMIGLFALAACQTAPTPPNFSMPRYDGFSKIPVNAASVRVVQAYQPTAQKPFVDHQFPISIASAAEQWVKDRVEASGADGVVVFTITDASVREEQLARTTGIQGAFTKDQIAKFTGRLTVNAELQQAQTPREANAQVNVSFMKTLPEDSSIQDREIMLHNMMKMAIDKFNTAMEAHLRQRFKP